MPFILLASQKYYTINSFPPEWFNLGTLLKRLRKKLKFLQSGLTNAEFVMTRLNSLSCTCINLEIIERLKVDFTWNVVPLGPVRDAMWKVLCGVQILTRASLIHLFVFLKQKMWHVELSLYSIALPGPHTAFSTTLQHTAVGPVPAESSPPTVPAGRAHRPSLYGKSLPQDPPAVTQGVCNMWVPAQRAHDSIRNYPSRMSCFPIRALPWSRKVPAAETQHRLGIYCIWLFLVHRHQRGN